MQNKLHTTLCHLESGLNTSNKQKNIVYSFLFFLCSFFSNAQTYNWDWAISGGGTQGADLIYDVKVGSDNNYYFIGSMYGTIGVQLDGNPVNVYNSSLGGDDIFLFSTTCDGQVRWSQAIGGGGSLDFAYNLELDSSNNVYVGVHINAVGTSVSFSPDPNHSVAPLPNPQAYNRIYLVKYNSNGQYQGKKALQGNVDNTNNQAQLSNLFIDNDTIHFITGLRSGNHLDNNVTVSTEITGFQYFIAKYDSDLNYISSLPLPIADGTGFSNYPVHFAYDKNLNRYYISSIRDDNSSLIPLAYDNKTVTNRSYIIAFSGADATLEWLREIYSQPTIGQPVATNRINSLKIDTNSDIYIGGNIFKSPNETNLKIYDPTDTSVQPYLFTPGADWTIPMIAKLNSSGIVQWVQTTAAYNSNALTPGPRYGGGIAISGNEVVFATQGSNEFWDDFQIQRPVSHQPDPVLIRFNKLTGAVIGVHEIEGSLTESQQSMVAAVDSDGNYIVGGNFTGGLFTNNSSSISAIHTVGNTDFFTAKLAASLCGTTVKTQKFSTLNVNVYPNPTTDIINIETQETLQNYEVYNILGEQIQKGMFNGNNQINLQGTTAGTYLIKVTSTQGSTVVKVLKN